MANDVANLLARLLLASQSIRAKGLAIDRWRARSKSVAAPSVAGNRATSLKGEKGNVVGRNRDRLVAKGCLSSDIKLFSSIVRDL
jgi:hypothetical protein